MASVPKDCYLCGRTLVAPTSRDHVPPKQLYSDEVRRVHSPNLLTIPVHAACNRAFQEDEDYFANTLAPFALGSNAGDSYLREVFAKFAEGKKLGLVYKVLGEFDSRPSGLILPDGQVAKRFEGQRLHRVAWKIVRGLYFHDSGSVLHESTPNHLQIVPPGERPPEIFFLLPDQPIRGQYPGVFDYKFAAFPEAHGLNYWAMLLWDKIILLIAHHDATCTCENCARIRSEASYSSSSPGNGA